MGVAAGVRADEWLAGVLGYPAYAVDPGGEPHDERGLHYAKVPVVDVAEVRRLLGAGFYVVDTNVTLSHRGTPAEASPLVGPARPEHHAALLGIAGSCFRFSRFHLDPAIPEELADRVKREWVRSYVEGRRGLELLVALEGDRPAGFLAVLAAGEARVIDLVGVAREAQGRGVGRALVETFVARHAGRELLVGTQVANVPSLALYRNTGFGIARSAYVLHRHVR